MRRFSTGGAVQSSGPLPPLPASAPRLPLPPPQQPFATYGFPQQPQQQQQRLQYTAPQAEPRGVPSPMMHQQPGSNAQSQSATMGLGSTSIAGNTHRAVPPHTQPAGVSPSGGNFALKLGPRETTGTAGSAHTTADLVLGNNYPQAGRRYSTGGLAAGVPREAPSAPTQQPWGAALVPYTGAGGATGASLPGGTLSSPVSSLPSGTPHAAAAAMPAMPTSYRLGSFSGPSESGGGGGATAVGAAAPTVGTGAGTGPSRGRKRELASLLASSPSKGDANRSGGVPAGTPARATMPVEGGGPGSKGETDRTFEVTRYGRPRMKPLAYWSSEKLVMGVKHEGVQGIHRGSEVGELVFSAVAKGPTPSKSKRRSSIGGSKGGGGGGKATTPRGKMNTPSKKGKGRRSSVKVEPLDGGEDDATLAEKEVVEGRGEEGGRPEIECEENHGEAIGEGNNLEDYSDLQQTDEVQMEGGGARGRGRGRGPGRGRGRGRGGGGGGSVKSPTPRKSNPKSTPSIGGKIRKEESGQGQGIDGVTPPRSRSGPSPSKKPKLSPMSGLATLAAAAGAQASAAVAAAKKAAAGGASYAALTPSAPPSADAEDSEQAHDKLPVTGQALPVVEGVSAGKMAELATTPLSMRAKRCGECLTCTAASPGRKKACEAIKALKMAAGAPGSDSPAKRKKQSASKTKLPKEVQGEEKPLAGAGLGTATAAEPNNTGVEGIVGPLLTAGGVPDFIDSAQKIDGKQKEQMKSPHQQQAEVKTFQRKKQGNAKADSKRPAEDLAPSEIAEEEDAGRPRRSTRQKTTAHTSEGTKSDAKEGHQAMNTADTAGNTAGAVGAGPSGQSLKPWSAEEIAALKEATLDVQPDQYYWQKVAARMPGRSVKECYDQYYDEYPTPQPNKKSKGSKLLVAVNDKAQKELELRPGASKKAIKNAVRKKGQQERLQKKAEQLAAASGDEGEMAEALVRQRDNARYVDQLLRGRNGKPLGTTTYRAPKPPAAPAVPKKGSKAAEELTAALAAARENSDWEKSDDDEDYYWSDAE